MMEVELLISVLVDEKKKEKDLLEEDLRSLPSRPSCTPPTKA